MLTVGSLFSGIGGLDLGLERAGMRVVWQSEIDEYASAVLRKHWPDVPNLGDITKIDWNTVAPVDVICGGFPCQPFSIAGLRRGENDERWLWAYIIEALSVLRPRYAILENVPGLLTIDDGQTYGRIIADLCGCSHSLAARGFSVEWQCIPAAAVGAPIIRDRVWILAVAGDGQQLRWPTVREAHDSNGLREAADGEAQERGDDWQLTALVPGVHQRASADWWRAQSRMDRSANGVPNWVERNRALGNAVVPQVAEYVGRCVVAHYKAVHSDMALAA